MFDWIEVRGIGWQIFQNVARIFDHRFRVGTFVKGCVVHHQDRPRWQFRYQVVAKPEIENICINIGCGQADDQESARQQGADDVDPSARVPVVFARTALPAQAVAVGAGHIVGKAALVYVDNGFARGFKLCDPLAEGVSCVVVRLRMTERFFYM